MTAAAHVVVRMVQTWTRLYTFGLPEDDRVRRRQEIESDLWESLNDQHAPLRPWALLVRLIIGIPNDLGWRVEHPREARPLMFALAFAGVCTLMLVALLAWAGSASSLPRPEPLVRLQSDQRPPPPPPPPPARPDAKAAR
jgi:hypothetical protein